MRSCASARVHFVFSGDAFGCFRLASDRQHSPVKVSTKVSEIRSHLISGAATWPKRLYVQCPFAMHILAIMSELGGGWRPGRDTGKPLDHPYPGGIEKPMAAVPARPGPDAQREALVRALQLAQDAGDAPMVAALWYVLHDGFGVDMPLAPPKRQVAEKRPGFEGEPGSPSRWSGRIREFGDDAVQASRWGGDEFGHDAIQAARGNGPEQDTTPGFEDEGPTRWSGEQEQFGDDAGRASRWAGRREPFPDTARDLDF